MRYAEGVEEISEDEINSIAEELTKEELEELEVGIGNWHTSYFSCQICLIFSLHRL